jgi:hypothetical protein
VFVAGNERREDDGDRVRTCSGIRGQRATEFVGAGAFR